MTLHRSVLLTALLCLLVAQPASSRIRLIPYPQTLKEGKGAFRPDRSTLLYIDVPDSVRARLLQALPWQNVSATSALPASEQKSIILRTSAVGSSPESYRLHVDRRHILLEAATGQGLFYGLQSLRQLMDRKGGIPAVDITDAPRFPYRGLMIDISRHFFNKAFLEKQIDEMARLKLNRLHLHLTDAAGWRLEIKRYPRLTQLGAWRTYARWKDWWFGPRHYSEEGSDSAHGGFLTQEDARQLVAYAAARYVTIIPEIEMPAHSEEALTAYPALSCTHELYKQADFCPGNDSVYVFLENVLSEVMDIFPSAYLHVGGDEAGKASWHSCPRCQALAKRLGYASTDLLQGYLMRRISRYVESKGRHILGWDEVMSDSLQSEAAVMVWRDETTARQSVTDGHPTIMAPGRYCYLDAYQDEPRTQPEAIGGYLPLEKVYSFDPLPAGLSAGQAALLRGIQGNLWTEYVPTPEHAEYMLYPRAFAIAENGWSLPQRKSWPRFKDCALAELCFMKQAGYHPFDLLTEHGNRPEALKPIRHLALGKCVTYRAPWYDQYKASGLTTLTDGLSGGWTYNDNRWQGFISRGMLDVVIDMEKVTKMQSIQAAFIQVCGPGVFFPGSVIISLSDDGTNYREIYRQTYPAINDEQVRLQSFGWKGHDRARFIRYQATRNDNGGFVFTDEIIVR